MVNDIFNKKIVPIQLKGVFSCMSGQNIKRRYLRTTNNTDFRIQS